MKTTRNHEPLLKPNRFSRFDPAGTVARRLEGGAPGRAASERGTAALRGFEAAIETRARRA